MYHLWSYTASCQVWVCASNGWHIYVSHGVVIGRYRYPPAGSKRWLALLPEFKPSGAFFVFESLNTTTCKIKIYIQDHHQERNWSVPKECSLNALLVACQTYPNDCANFRK